MQRECSVAEIICRKKLKKEKYLPRRGVEAELFAEDSLIWKGKVKSVKNAERALARKLCSNCHEQWRS